LSNPRNHKKSGEANQELPADLSRSQMDNIEPLGPEGALAGSNGKGLKSSVFSKVTVFSLKEHILLEEIEQELCRYFRIPRVEKHRFKRGN